MKLRIVPQMLRLTRPHRFLRWSRNALLVIGVVALGYCGFVLLDAKLYQDYQARRFQQQLSSVRSAIISTGGVPNPTISPISEGALGRIEITRIGLAAMILEGTDERTLRHAVGHIPGTPMPGSRGTSRSQDTETHSSGRCAMSSATTKSD